MTFSFTNFDHFDLLVAFTSREQKTSTGINLTEREGPSAEKKAKKEESQTVIVEKVNFYGSFGYSFLSV